MPKDLEEYVARNSKHIRDVDSRFQAIDSNRDRSLTFGQNVVNVSVSITVESRPTGDQVVFGHDADSKGFSRGTFGDDRGTWSQETSTEASADFTKDGRKAVVEALDAQTGAVAEGGVGSDTTAVGTNDTALGNETGRRLAFSTQSSNVTTSKSPFRSTDVVGTPAEFGLFDGNGRLLARVTVDPSGFSVGDTDEVRGIIDLTFTGSGNGSSVVTNTGEEVIADAMRSIADTVGLQYIRVGSGDTDFSKTDTSLTTQEVEKRVRRDVGRDRVTALTRVLESDMSSVSNDLSEASLADNNGRMIWATTFRAIPSDTPGFDIDVTLSVS